MVVVSSRSKVVVQVVGQVFLYYDSCFRLCQLLKLIGVATVQEISSKQKNNRRGRFLRQFAAGKINV